jgi:GNAT superfamily N-acetyltransferase
MPVLGPSALLRTLTIADLPDALTLSGIAGWNQTKADWTRVLRLNRQLCLCVECDGKVVATTTLVAYKDELAWLGMVLTHPHHRKQGFARCLVESALTLVDDRGIRSVKLDATEQGFALYSKLGFREEQAIERWSGSGSRSIAPSPRGILSSSHFELDREAFGADRGCVLLSLGKTAFVEQDGFAMRRPGAGAAQLGPCISSAQSAAHRLIASCLSTNRGKMYWDLLPSNTDAVKMAKEFDFKPVRRLIRMVKGEQRKGRDSLIYAAGGFELG